MNTDDINHGFGSLRSWLRRIWPQRISATDRALIGAHGKVLAMLATTLQSSGHLDARRFSETLALFGAVVSEEDRLQGAILALWASALEENLELADATSA